MISTRSADKQAALEAEGLPTALVDLSNLSATDTKFWQADVFIVTITPAAQAEVAQLAAQIAQTKPKLVLVTSSTAVYPNTGGVVVEHDAVYQVSPHSGRDLLKLENLYQGLPVTITRFGGLFGGSRQPGRFLCSGKTIAAGDAPVNMTHLNDAVGAIVFLMKHGDPLGAVNVVSPEHPTKRTFYTKAAQKLGVENPTFFNGSGQFKVVSSQRLVDLGYSFRVQNPLEAI